MPTEKASFVLRPPMILEEQKIEPHREAISEPIPQKAEVINVAAINDP
jgi:hypothetical protein